MIYEFIYSTWTKSNPWVNDRKLFSFESHPIIQPSALGWLGATSHPLVSGLVIGCHRVLKAHMLHILHIHWKGCGCSDLEWCICLRYRKIILNRSIPLQTRLRNHWSILWNICQSSLLHLLQWPQCDVRLAVQEIAAGCQSGMPSMPRLTTPSNQPQKIPGILFPPALPIVGRPTWRNLPVGSFCEPREPLLGVPLLFPTSACSWSDLQDHRLDAEKQHLSIHGRPSPRTASPDETWSTSSKASRKSLKLSF